MRGVDARGLVPLLLALAVAAALGGCARGPAAPAAARLGKVPIQFQSDDPGLAGAELVVFGATSAAGPFAPLHREPVRWRSADGPQVLFVHEGQPLGAERWYYVAARDQTGGFRKLVPVTKARVLLPSAGAAPQPQTRKSSR
jgi:hypothetical protein